MRKSRIAIGSLAALFAAHSFMVGCVKVPEKPTTFTRDECHLSYDDTESGSKMEKAGLAGAIVGAGAMGLAPIYDYRIGSGGEGLNSAESKAMLGLGAAFLVGGVIVYFVGHKKAKGGKQEWETSNCPQQP